MRQSLALFFVTAWPQARGLGRLLSLVAVALGVALGYAVHLINRAAVEELAAAVRTLSGSADLEVRAAGRGFDETLLAMLARTEGVAGAAPMLEVDAALADRRGTVRLVGIDPLRSDWPQPAPQGSGEEGTRYGLLAPDSALVSAAAAARLELRPGSRLRLLVGSAIVELEIIGVLPAAAFEGVAVLSDIATVQWRLGRVGELNRIALRAAAPEEVPALRERVARLLPANAYAATPGESALASANPSRAYRVNLDALALVALCTGGFLVFSAESLQVMRRRREHALLRALGLERAGVARLVLMEAAAVGLAGGVLGIAAGYALALIGAAYSGGDLGAGFFRSGMLRLRPDAAGALGYLLAGTLVALAGAWFPARDAARRAPARALKAGDEQGAYLRPARVWPGFVLLLGAAALSGLPPIAGLPLFGYAAIACLLLGAIALMPRILQAVLAAWPEPRRAIAALALAQLRGAPAQAMVSLASILASFSLMVAMAIMVGSFRVSLSEWLEAALPADLYVRPAGAGEGAHLDAALAASMGAASQFSRVEFLRSQRIVLDPARAPVTVVGRDPPQRGREAAFSLVGQPYPRREGDPSGVLVSEAMLELYGFAPGRRISLPGARGQSEFVVTGVFRDYARQHGTILMARADYTVLTGDSSVGDAALWLQPRVAAAEAIQLLRALPGGGTLDIASAGELRVRSLRIFDRSFAITYALEAVAVLIGLFGLSASLGAIVLARRGELGMLRHLGLSRRQVGGMLSVEAAALAALGAAAGLATGFAVSLVLIRVVNRQSFNWSMDLHVPWLLLVSLSAALVALAALTAWLSAREATGQDPVRAVREDW